MSLSANRLDADKGPKNGRLVQSANIIHRTIQTFPQIRVDVTLSCMMKLARFPMDSQKCPLIIQSYAYVERVLKLNWHIAPPFFPLANNPDIKLNDMVITGRTHEYCGGTYPMMRGYGNWSCIRAQIVMKRLVLFHVIQTYIPTAMLVVISWMSFWLDARAAPARISLTITTLLTLTTMSNGARQDLPQVSYVKALDIWLSFCQAFVFCVLLEYTLVSFFITRRTTKCHHILTAREMNNAYAHTCQKLRSWWANTSASADENANCSAVSALAATTTAAASDQFEPLNRRYQRALLGATGAAGANGGGPNIASRAEAISKPCQVCSHRWEKISKKIDRCSRYLFPSLYVVFSGFYWLWYLFSPVDDE